MFKLIGQRVRKYRLLKNYTQQELAKEIDLSSQYISQVERGMAAVTLETLEKICLALDISIEKIFVNFENIERVKNNAALLSIIELMEDQPTEVLEELLNINIAIIDSIHHLRSKK